MKLKLKNIYTGNVMIKMGNNNSIYTETEYLYKINDEYATVNDLAELPLSFRILGRITKSEYYMGNITMKNEPKEVGDLYVDEETLYPYFSRQCDIDKMPAKQLVRYFKGVSKKRSK